MINSIIETFNDFLAFLKKPVEQPDPVQNWPQKLKRLFSLVAIDVPIMVVVMLIAYGIEKFGLVNTEKHKVLMLLQQLPIWMIMLFGVVIMPFIEELIFRLYLRFKQNYLARFIILLASLAGNQNKIRIENLLTNFWVNNFRGIFYFSAILFGLVHLTNFEYSINILLLAPILIAPQFIIGLFSGYLRIKYNLLLGFLMHALHNAIFLIIPLIFMSNSDEKLNVKTDSYSLSVEEITLNQSNTSSSLKTDTINFKGASIKSIIAFLIEKDENLIESNNTPMADKKINLNFIRHIKDSSNNQNIIFYHLSQVYNFKIEVNTRLQETWELVLKDSAMLFKYKSKTSGNSSSTSMSSKEVKIENADLIQIAKELSSNYNKYIISNADIKGNFDFIIPKKDFTDLENLLTSQYGLSFRKTEKEIEYTYINFKKSE